MPWDGVLVRFGEIGIKSAPVRRAMVERLRRNLLDNLERSRVEGDVASLGSRLWMAGPDAQALAEVAVRTFGVVTASPARRVPAELEPMAAACAELALARGGWTSFAVRASREGNHGFTSQGIGVHCGSAVFVAAQQAGRPVKVDLTAPELDVSVDVRDRDAYIFLDRLEGPGGLPIGTQGRVVVLFDRPHAAAAAWLMMRRGCEVVAAVPQGPGTGQGGGSRPDFDALRPWGLDAVVPIPNAGDAVQAAGDLARREQALAVAIGDTLQDPLRSSEDPVLLRPVCGLDAGFLRRIEGRLGR